MNDWQKPLPAPNLAKADSESMNSLKPKDKEPTTNGSGWFLKPDPSHFLVNLHTRMTVLGRDQSAQEWLDSFASSSLAEVPNVFAISRLLPPESICSLIRWKLELHGTFSLSTNFARQTLRERGGSCSLNFPGRGKMPSGITAAPMIYCWRKAVSLRGFTSEAAGTARGAALS